MDAGSHARQPSAIHASERSRVTVPHPQKDIPIGTLRNIYRQAGWPWREKGGR